MKKVFLIICDIFMEAFLTFAVINAFEGFISNPDLITFAAVVFFIFMMFVSPFILWAKMNDASDPDYSISEDPFFAKDHDDYLKREQLQQIKKINRK